MTKKIITLIVLILIYSSSYAKTYQYDNGSLIFPKKYYADTNEFSIEEEKLKTEVLFKESGKFIIGVQGFFMTETFMHDATSRRVYLINRKGLVLSRYHEPLGWISELHKAGPYYIITDLTSRGGSGGSDATGNINIFKIVKNKIVTVFSFPISYESSFRFKTFPEYFGYYAIKNHENTLLILISKKELKIPNVKPLNSKSDINKYFHRVYYKDIEKNPGTIFIDLTNKVDIKKAIKRLKKM